MSVTGNDITARASFVVRSVDSSINRGFRAVAAKTRGSRKG